MWGEMKILNQEGMTFLNKQLQVLVLSLGPDNVSFSIQSSVFTAPGSHRLRHLSFQSSEPQGPSSIGKTKHRNHLPIQRSARVNVHESVCMQMSACGSVVVLFYNATEK